MGNSTPTTPITPTTSTTFTTPPTSITFTTGTTTYLRPRFFSTGSFPSFASRSRSARLSINLRVDIFLFNVDWFRVLYRRLRTLFRTPEPCTRFEKRRSKLKLLSFPVFCTSTFIFTADIGRRITQRVRERNPALRRHMPVGARVLSEFHSFKIVREFS